MSAGTGVGGAVASILLEADPERVGLDLQITSGHETFLAFGKAPTAVKATGLSLVLATEPRMRFTDVRCKQAVSIVCAAAEASVVGYDAI
jgi:hypothetical protein